MFPVCVSRFGTLFLQPEASGADSDDDWSMGAKKGKKGKAAAAGKGKGGKAATSNSSSSSGAAAGGKQKGAADVNSILGVNVLTQQVLKLYPDMEDAGGCVEPCVPLQRVLLQRFSAGGIAACCLVALDAYGEEAGELMQEDGQSGTVTWLCTVAAAP